MVGALGRKRGGNSVASPVGISDAEIIQTSGITVSKAVITSSALTMNVFIPAPSAP